LIIDDVDLINKSLLPTLQSLITYTDDRPPLIRLIISGEDIPEHLNNILPQENNAPAIKYLPIPPMSEKETNTYIKFRLNASGYKAVEPFNKKNLRRIYLDSKGFPKYINQLADLLLGQYAQTSGDKQNFLPLSDEANKNLKIVSAALGVLIVVFLIYGMLDTDEPTTTDIALEDDIKPLAVPVIKDVPPAAPQKENKPLIRVAEPKKIEPEKSQPSKTESGKTKPREAIPQAHKLAEAKPQAAIPKTTQADTKPEIKKPGSATKITVPKEVKPAHASKKLSPLQQDLQWINAQNAKNYTIQLIGTGKIEAAESFIKKHHIEKGGHYFHKKRKGKDWYSVIYGSYSSAREAKAGVEKLPSSLKKIKPWIRQFKNIQSK
ncbi:MAG: SPOR domain-containing protein, partial [Gammaproteobacteria bacterium]|nr:SPOR domain-containing protein [Gammaproteobacteria bacterium]